MEEVWDRATPGSGGAPCAEQRLDLGVPHVHAAPRLDSGHCEPSAHCLGFTPREVTTEMQQNGSELGLGMEKD